MQYDFLLCNQHLHVKKGNDQAAIVAMMMTATIMTYDLTVVIVV